MGSARLFFYIDRTFGGEKTQTKWRIPSTLVSGGLTYLVIKYFQIVLDLWEKTPCWEEIFSEDYVVGLPWTARESAHTGISDKSDGIESDLETQQMKVTWNC